MLVQPVIYKEICTTGTQTDDNDCVNGCTSMYINLDHIQNNTETSPQKPDLDKVGDDLHIEPGPGSILDDDGATCEQGEKKYLDKIDKVLEETHGANMDGENSDTANYPVNAFIESEFQEGGRDDTKYLDCNIARGGSVQDNLNNNQDISVFDNSLSLSVESEIQDQHLMPDIHQYNINQVKRKSNKDLEIPCSEYCQKKKAFGCSCSNTYEFKSLLQVHLRKHTGEKLFECSKCNRKFARKYDLKSHLIIHTNDMPFECSSCKKQFKHKKSLRRHVIIHTEEKPFECSYEHCRKTFRWNDGLQAHLKTHLRKTVFNCTFCKRTFEKKTASHRNKSLKCYLLQENN